MAAPIPCTKLQLSISLKNISKLDVGSKSDPYVVLAVKDRSGRDMEVGRTETVKNAVDCKFSKVFEIDYFFEEVQNVTFTVFDHDKDSADDIIGSTSTTIGAIVGEHRGVFTSALSHKSHHNRGTIIVSVEESKEARGIVHLTARGTGLDKKDLFGKSDPYFTIDRESPQGVFTQVYKSETIMKTLDPHWKNFSLSVKQICNGDYDRKLKIEVYDWDSDGSHDLIGICNTTMREIIDKKNLTLDLICPKKVDRKGYKNSGTFTLASTVEEEYGFLDYLRGGYGLNFTVAVDFTGSNGDPRTPQSLHFLNPVAPNSYAQAITAVGSVIQDYDSDKLFPALGFGAKLPDGTVSHEFSLTGDASNPYCQGIQGVLAAYQRTVGVVTLWGPTNLAPIINHTASFAVGAKNAYFVLLVLTDGEITDMDDTIEAIVRASSLPLSIIIVGVGMADFSKMELLDGDKRRLSSKGRMAERDIVQFVPFVQFSGPHAAADLARAVLAELPNQFVEYMKVKGIKPAPPLVYNPQAPVPQAPPGAAAAPGVYPP